MKKKKTPVRKNAQNKRLSGKRIFHEGERFLFALSVTVGSALFDSDMALILVEG
ncbi:MAG: hypothetical protein IJF84_02730 [Thermoguttaceae bacterium]|nr:hypothetical protein [Thermoguttaceae bacterium]